MCADISYDTVINAAKDMRSRSFACKFPEQSALWNRLLSNEAANFIPVGIALFDRNFVLLKCNKLYQDYINSYSYYSSDDAIGMEYFDLFGNARSYLVEIFKGVRDTSHQHTSHEYPVSLDYRITFQKTYWDAKLIPVRDHNNRSKGLALATLDVTGRVEAANRIQNTETEIAELKAALRTVMKLRQEDQAIYEQKTMANIKNIIEPFLTNLKKSLMQPDQISNLDGIEFGINKYVYEFSHLFGTKQYILTPKEIQVAALIKMGKTTKEIAECFHISPSSIDFHRKNIRTKLNLKNKKVNLRSYLSSFFKS